MPPDAAAAAEAPPAAPATTEAPPTAAQPPEDSTTAAEPRQRPLRRMASGARPPAITPPPQSQRAEPPKQTAQLPDMGGNPSQRAMAERLERAKADLAGARAASAARATASSAGAQSGAEANAAQADDATPVRPEAKADGSDGAPSPTAEGAAAAEQAVTEKAEGAAAAEGDKAAPAKSQAELAKDILAEYERNQEAARDKEKAAQAAREKRQAEINSVLSALEIPSRADIDRWRERRASGQLSALDAGELADAILAADEKHQALNKLATFLEAEATAISLERIKGDWESAADLAGVDAVAFLKAPTIREGLRVIVDSVTASVTKALTEKHDKVVEGLKARNRANAAEIDAAAISRAAGRPQVLPSGGSGPGGGTVQELLAARQSGDMNRLREVYRRTVGPLGRRTG